MGTKSDRVRPTRINSAPVWACVAVQVSTSASMFLRGSSVPTYRKYGVARGSITFNGRNLSEAASGTDRTSSSATPNLAITSRRTASLTVRMRLARCNRISHGVRLRTRFGPGCHSGFLQGERSWIVITEGTGGSHGTSKLVPWNSWTPLSRRARRSPQSHQRRLVSLRDWIRFGGQSGGVWNGWSDISWYLSSGNSRANAHDSSATYRWSPPEDRTSGVASRAIFNGPPKLPPPRCTKQ